MNNFTEDQQKWRDRLDCPLCGSKKTRFRFRANNMRCGKCGHIWERPPLEG